MPRNEVGQLITFSIEVDADQKYQSSIWVKVNKGDTVRKIAARRGDPEDARRIADMNGIRSVLSKLSRPRIKVPGQLRAADTFHVLAGEQAPRIVAGYAKYEVVDRDQRVGLTMFRGFDPISMEVPIRFDAYRSGSSAQNERDIVLLERMAGRGNFSGAAIGPPPVIRVSTTNASGAIVPLIPENYQWSADNPSAPTWRVAGIEWDEEPVRDDKGRRIRQMAVVTVQQYVKVASQTRSVTQRSKAKKKKR